MSSHLAAGGGYVYRMCPKDAEPTEACFTSHVLGFATNTTTVRSPWGEFADFEILAHDVGVGTHPAGSSWRMNPIPACNCDLGEEGSCWGGDSKGYGIGGNFTKAYEIDPQAPKKTPRCPTGVQFSPAWPEGCALPTPKPCVLRMPCFPWLSDEDQNWVFFVLAWFPWP